MKSNAFARIDSLKLKSWLSDLWLIAIALLFALALFLPFPQKPPRAITKVMTPAEVYDLSIGTDQPVETGN